jgi:hypothetical protein
MEPYSADRDARDPGMTPTRTTGSLVPDGPTPGRGGCVRRLHYQVDRVISSFLFKSVAIDLFLPRLRKMDELLSVIDMAKVEVATPRQNHRLVT